MTDFFDKKDNAEEEKQEEKSETEEETTEEIEKVKVGENEYTKEELSSLVSLGKIGKEAEEKYNTKIDKVWPEYTKTSQELKELRAKLETEEKARVDKKVEAGIQLTEEEQVKQALAQADKIGIATKDSVRRQVMEVLEARDLIDECKGLAKEVDGKDGRPAFKTQDVLAHMQETGIKNPLRAYKDKFESQIDRWKEDQLGKAKPKGMTTEETSSAGTKEPKAKSFKGMSEDDLRKEIRESLGVKE